MIELILIYECEKILKRNLSVKFLIEEKYDPGNKFLIEYVFEIF
jgi:hypothetical protein